MFEKYPFLTSLTWTQYTPYFNDGHTCEFGVDELNFTLGENDLGMPVWNENEADSYYEKQSTYMLMTGVSRNRSYPSPAVEQFANDIEKLQSVLYGMEDVLEDVSVPVHAP